MCATMAAVGPFSKSSKSCKSSGATFHLNGGKNGLRKLRSLRLMAKISQVLEPAAGEVYLKLKASALALIA
jgi:hypothetical protein